MDLPWESRSNLPHFLGDFPDFDGVYAIAQRARSITIPHVQYVGQGNIRDRMTLHMGPNEPNQCLMKIMGDAEEIVYVRFAQIDDYMLRNNVEHTLYKKYKSGYHHLCNENTPPGNLITISNPPFPYLAR